MGINLGQTSMKAVYLGQTAVKSVFFGDKQVCGLGPVVLNYDIQSIGRSTSEQGTSIEITEQAGETITLYIKTNATDLTNKQVCAAVYLDSTDVTPYASFAFSNMSLAGRYITGTTPDVSAWVPNGFPDTYSTLYMKTWIQDAGYIDPVSALGEVLDWTGEEPPPAAEPLCFTLDRGSSLFTEQISLDKTGSPNPISLEYSTDGNTWSDYTWNGNSGLAINLSNNGDKVYFRAKNENQTINADGTNVYTFRAAGWSGIVRISGNIQTLLKADGTRTDAPSNCYRELFSNQIDFKSAPRLPATTLADGCYSGMFRSCASLTSAPELPATALAEACYGNMFNGCTSLTSAPALPATTLFYWCYGSMFQNCTSLTSAPELPATTLADSCYSSMFSGCASLSSVGVSFTAWNPTNATTNWLNGVASSGTFTCPAALPDTRGASNIPEGWTKVDAA